LTTIGRRLRRDRRGVSNIIVVVLSLVIIIAIVSNVFLWSYQMNQLDWEKMKEDMSITNVVRVTRSSWFTVESEYIVGKGSLVSGNYTDTQAIDSSNETFREAPTQQETIHPNAAGQYAQWTQEYPSGSAHWDCCDEDPPDDDSSYVETNTAAWKYEAYNLENHTGSGTINWVRVYVRAKFTSAGTSNFRTLIRTYDTDYESGDITLSTSYQNNYTQYDTNPNTGLAWTWDEIDSLQAGASGRKSGTINIRMTAVWVVINYLPVGGYELDLNGGFTIDLSTYPLTSIETVEIQLRYRAGDAGEKWYLKAYNWTAATYSDNGFNSTAGHTPTTGWDYYAVNLTDQWSSYVQSNGTMYVNVVDAGSDGTQTTIDIDFLGVRVGIDWTRFTFENDGSLTSNLVSLWINNSTIHQRYDMNVFVNSGETLNYTRSDISLPSGEYTVKVVTKRGNTAVFSGS
jgi:hypothetical protein